MPNPEVGNQPSQEAKNYESAPAEVAANRAELERELYQVEDEMKKAEQERDSLREEFKKANDAEYLARLRWQQEKSANPQSVDLGILEDAQKANKALAEMYQRKLDGWDSSAYYELQQKKQELEAQLRN